MAAKVHVRVASIEVEFETDEKFSYADLKDLLSDIWSHSSGASLPGTEPVEGKEPQILQLSWEQVFARTKQDNLPGVLLAAAGYLHFMQGMPTFTQADLVNVIQSSPVSSAMYPGGDISNDIVGTKMVEEIAENPGNYRLIKSGEDLLRSIFLA